ncbi:protein sevenless [Bactrocera tryoni]|uniref:protein sevenless n=1 Tax=Bactrocera tryoni TaxID=59916 RepID=UPI001A99BB18|nr:protein sevenless [Bactrocera tryoni]
MIIHVDVWARLYTICHISCKCANKICDGISLASIMNSFHWLIILLLLVSCDMCKSNEYPVTSKAVTGSTNSDEQVTNVTTHLFDANIGQKIDLESEYATTQRGEIFDTINVKNATIINVTNECLEHCKLEAANYFNEYGLDCGEKGGSSVCFERRCTKGCEQWVEALTNPEGCQEICVSTQLHSLDLPCTFACEMGQRRYWDYAKETIEPKIKLEVPYVKMSNNTDEFKLVWNILFPDSFFASHQFSIYIQYQYIKENISEPQAWKNLTNFNCNRHFICEILNDLIPFAVYKFRYNLKFGKNMNQILHSPPTKPFRTKAKGVPLSKPLLKQAIALDPNHISITWEPGIFTCGPLKGYVLTLENANSSQKQILSHDRRSFVFSHLLPATKYSVKLSMLNSEGEGSFVETFIQTKVALLYGNSENIDLVLLAGEYSIRIKSLESLTDSELVFESEHLIIDYALYSYFGEYIVYIIDYLGNIMRVPWNDENPKGAIPTLDKLTEFKPKKISVDWLNKLLFIAVQTPIAEWAIISTDLDGNFHSFIIKNVTKSIDQMQVDPINGWLFWINNGSLIRTNLASNYSEIVIKSNVGIFSNNYQRSLIIFYNTSDHELYESTFDGKYKQNLRLKLSASMQQIQSFWYNGIHLLGTNGTHLFRKNYNSNEYDISMVRELEWCWSITPLTRQANFIQAQPTLEKIPENVRAFVTSKMAKIVWNEPKLNEYQTEYAWRKWDYELEIMDLASNSAFNIRNIKTNYFNVEKLQPNNVYKFRVRVVLGGTMGLWSRALLTRTWPFGEYIFLAASLNGIYEINETGEHIEQVGQMENVRDFVQLNATIYYITQDNRLQCANIINPEINCSFTATNAISLSYEWRGGKMYWVDSLGNCVKRANLDGSQEEMLPIFRAEYIAIDSHNGHIYYSTRTRLVRRLLGDTLDTDEYEYYHTNTNEDIISGFALDIIAKRLFWVVRKGDGDVQLFRVSIDMFIDDLQYSFIENDIQTGSIEFLHEIDSVIWLKSNSNAIIFARAGNSTNEMQIELPQLSKINCIYLKSSYILSIDLSVVPEAVDIKSIRINQAYTNEWIIRWHPVNTSENYTIFYNILLQFNNSKYPTNVIYKTNESFVVMDKTHTLESHFNISITPFTYWSFGSTTTLPIFIPSTSISPPKQMRIFIEPFNDPLEAINNITATVRWESPENENTSSKMAYKIYCWLGKELHAERIYNSSNEQFYEISIDGLRIGESYVFQVQSFISGIEKQGQNSTIQLHINPEVQPKPAFIYATSEYIAEYDLDLNISKVLIQISSQVEHLAVMSSEKRILWVNENVELISTISDLKPIKLARMRAEVLSLTVDWIQRIVYWAELDTEDKSSVSIYELDLCQFEGKVMAPHKLLTLDRGKNVRDLTIMPFLNILLWLERDKEANTSSLAGRILSNSTFIDFETTYIDKMFVSSPVSVSLVDKDGNICIYDISKRVCSSQIQTVLANPEEIIKVDRDGNYIYILENEKVYSYSVQNKKIEYQVNIEHIKNVKAYNYQHFPERNCLLPDHNILLKNKQSLNPKVISVGENYMTLSFPNLDEIEKCKVKVPGIKNTLWITDNDKVSRSHITFDNTLNVTNIQPFTNYTLQLSISSYYQRKFKLDEWYSDIMTVLTDVGTPSMPLNFTAYALNPTQIYVMWNPPERPNCGKVWYELHWQETISSEGAYKRINGLNYLVTNLESSREYKFWLKAFSTKSKFNSTLSVIVKTFETPSRLWLVKKSAHNFTLSWVTSDNVTRSVLACQEVNGDNEFSIDITEDSSLIVVPNLDPKTKYQFFLEIFYGSLVDPYIWPEVPNEYFIYETLGAAPGRPGQPQIEHTISDVFRIFWDAAPNNGELITEYSLEALQARKTKRIRRSQAINLDYINNSVDGYSQVLWAEEPSPIEDKWIVACSTTELSCIIREIYIQRLLMFRVRARNDLYGWGPYSVDSERISEPFVSPEKRDSLVLAIITPAAIVSTFVIILILLRTLQVRRQKAKKLLEKSRPSIWSNISTLQHQQLMASRNRAFSTTSHSTLYTGGPLSDADIALLPHINWSQITILHFLGSGAFGEVYEGLIKHENSDQQEKVAIKSLRKGASEFAELLQEAQLMSNFKHDNIVQLIGVCFDTESISIIMEHMEGGDLLTYVRNSRPNSKRPIASLKLLDLISMCIDVCKGCCYLEDMHFVHRDLACRNCLVSSNDPSKRMVKIGDFGLARDIYKSDYYRKEGEGLLPVRWMSPESLVDGIFTTHSDVWAFAVLCWEIFTLGQQPYAARNNYEVLNYVKDGGRLEKPETCPAELFTLLLQCWSKPPEDRPSFGNCFVELLRIKTELRRINLGFTNDSSDNAVYANQEESCLSTFPMFTVAKKKAHKVPTEPINSNVSLLTQLETFYQDVGTETISDDSQLIETEIEVINIGMSSQINEAISRL